MNYKRLDGGGVLRVDDNTSIPNNNDNRDWQEYQEWLAESNTPLPADPPPAPLTTRQKIIQRLRRDPILKAQVIDSFEARGITDTKLMLAALEAKYADVI